MSCLSWIGGSEFLIWSLTSCILHLLWLLFLLAMVCRYKNQNVAVKVMHKGDSQEDVAKREARYMREVAMLARGQHKNLVKVTSANGTLVLVFFLVLHVGCGAHI